MIPSGELFLRRGPGSPKSATECLYTDAVASIRETSSPHNFLLVIQRAYAEGEEQLRGDDDDEDEDLDESKDERVFLIDAELKVHSVHKQGNWSVSWSNIDGDEGESFEFVVEGSVKTSEVEQFMKTIHSCCFERKYQKSSAGTTNAQLKEFVYDPEEANDLAKDVQSLAQYEEDDSDDVYEDAQGDEEEAQHLQKVKTPAGTPISSASAQLHIYDPLEGLFKLQSTVNATVLDLGKWDYWLSLKGETLEIGAAITDELNSRFESSVSSFIFNYWVPEGAFTFLLKFVSEEELNDFKGGFMRAYHEHSNQSKWEKQDESEQEYALRAFDELEIDDELADEEDDEDEEDEEDEYEEEEARNTNLRTGLKKESLEEKADFKSQNNNLTISFKNDRSYVTNGDRIGVFHTTEDDELKYDTTIQNLNVDGKSFTPSKMMLHTEDRSLVMQGRDKNKLYRMDLERGKIVDEWKVGGEGLSVVEYGPSAKFNQMTGEQTFLGISDKGLFKLDPRLSGDKLVESEYKTYATKNGFSAFGTTENGYIAVASTKGDIRLYDRLGIRAKALLPAIGDNIKHVEVSADGSWLLATCKTYLMLIDLKIKEGKNSGKLGFQSSFGKDQLPKVRLLKIAPEHVAYMQATTKQSLDFSKAYFNTGVNVKEQTIVSSSGPYAITWSLKKILRGDAEPYMIKRYSSKVVADNFKYGDDKNVIIALEDDVGMVSKRAFRRADRNSLVGRPGFV